MNEDGEFSIIFIAFSSEVAKAISPQRGKKGGIGHGACREENKQPTLQPKRKEEVDGFGEG